MALRMNCTVNIDYFAILKQPVDLCSGYALCFLWSRKWIFK